MVAGAAQSAQYGENRRLADEFPGFPLVQEASSALMEFTSAQALN
ncbi:MAG: hypothetical protein Q9M35_01190 [Rhodothermus sp.]|nr:hypothetical protein [Rhodothermus sp.]